MKNLFRWILPAFLAATASANTVYNLVAGFSDSSNPNGVWTYGMLTGLGGTFTTLPDTFSALSGVNGWTNEATVPLVEQNSSGSSITSGTDTYPVGWLEMSPDSSGDYAVVQFTVPTTGSYTIAGAFEGLDSTGTTTDDHVWWTSGGTSTSLFDTGITAFFTNSPNVCPGSTGTTRLGACGFDAFSMTQNFTAGDTIDFTVGYGYNQNYFFDLTGLQGTVTLNSSSSTPEPGTWLLAGVGVVGMVVRKWRRSARRDS